MKLNKKIVALNLFACMLMMNQASAGLVRVKSPGGGSSSSSGADVTHKSSEVIKIPASKVSATSEASCSSDLAKTNYFPLALFPLITRDQAPIEISLRPNNKIMVRIPPVINVCGTFTPELRQNKDTKDVTVLMKLVSEKGEEVSYAAFETCLKDKGLVTTSKNGDELNLDGVSGKDFSEDIYSMDYEFDKKKEVTKSAKVTFGYARAYNDPKTGLKPIHATEKNELVAVPGEACIVGEPIAATPVYINEGREAQLSKINVACTSNDAQKIAEARKSLGNYDALRDIADKIADEMDAAYLVAVQKDADKIYKKMDEISARISKNSDMDEAKAKKEINLFVEQVKLLRTQFMDPALYRLDTLLTKREKIEKEDEESPALKAIDEEIKMLNEKIGAFAGKNNELDAVYDLMAKHAFNDSAKVVHDVFLKSKLYKNVYEGDEDSRGARISFDKATQTHTNKMKEFEKKLTDWSDENQAKKGNKAPLLKTEKEIIAVQKRRNARLQSYNQKENKDYQKYCTGMMGPANPNQCNAWMSGKASRDSVQQRMAQKDEAYITSKKAKYAKLNGGYSEHERRKIASDSGKAESYDPSANSSWLESSFEEEFPGYYGVQQPQYQQFNNGMAPQFNNGMQFQQQGWPGM